MFLWVCCIKNTTRKCNGSSSSKETGRVNMQWVTCKQRMSFFWVETAIAEEKTLRQMMLFGLSVILSVERLIKCLTVHKHSHMKSRWKPHVSFLSHCSKLPLEFRIIWPTNHDGMHFVSTNMGKLTHVIGMVCVSVENWCNSHNLHSGFRRIWS